jgi:hypothetical protein
VDLRHHDACEGDSLREMIKTSSDDVFIIQQEIAETQGRPDVRAED